jgi:uncharacterized membrane protein
MVPFDRGKNANQKGRNRLIDDVTFARAIHVIAVVFWIGGVAMVTTVLLPAVRRFKSPQERVAFFESVEQRFARQSRLSTLVAGLSGFYMIFRLDLWGRFAMAAFWWMHAMVGLWLLFTLMLFVLEPLFLHRRFLSRAKAAPEVTFRLVQRLHWLLLSLSIITIFGAVAGSHGSLFFSWE